MQVERRRFTPTSALKHDAVVCDARFKRFRDYLRVVRVSITYDLLLLLKTSISLHISSVDREQPTAHFNSNFGKHPACKPALASKAAALPNERGIVERAPPSDLCSHLIRQTRAGDVLSVCPLCGPKCGLRPRSALTCKQHADEPPCERRGGERETEIKPAIVASP